MSRSRRSLIPSVRLCHLRRSTAAEALLESQTDTHMAVARAVLEFVGWSGAIGSEGQQVPGTPGVGNVVEINPKRLASRRSVLDESIAIGKADVVAGVEDVRAEQGRSPII